MSAAAKGALIGVLLVVLIVGGVAVGVMTGLVPNPTHRAEAKRILVIASAPDADGAQLAALAFTVEPKTGKVTLMNTLEKMTISGTSASNARDALPFGGGAAVAEALAPQTGGEPLAWIVVPSKQWAPLVDQAAGIAVDVPEAVNSYAGGTLTVLEPGSQKLSGAEAAALASAAPFVGDEQIQERVLKELSAGVSAIVGSSGETVRNMVAAGTAQSSLESSDIPPFDPVR